MDLMVDRQTCLEPTKLYSTKLREMVKTRHWLLEQGAVTRKSPDVLKRLLRSFFNHSPESRTFQNEFSPLPLTVGFLD